MTHQKIRQKFLEYFESKGHAVVPSSSLLPDNDPTTLFTGSGMQPILPYLLGEKHPKGTRIVDVQKCFRAEDIDEVGDNRHTTFFEMLGNWSFGDYWKEEQLPWIFEFLTKDVGLEPEKLYVTVFSGISEIGEDKESIGIWKNLFSSKNIPVDYAQMGSLNAASGRGMKEGERIFGYDTKNWWSRAGAPDKMPAGEPGGPDSEIFYDFGTPHDSRFGEHCHPNCDCGRFLEIGNSVFMEYRKRADGSFEKLPQRNVDFGGGLERISAASENESDIFNTSAFAPIIKEIEQIIGNQISGSDYKNEENSRKIYRIIADHIKAATMLISDGVVPSNKDKGYVLRRLIRRAVTYAKSPGFNVRNLFTAKVAEKVIEIYSSTFENLVSRREDILKEFNKEENKFIETLDKGLREINKFLDEKGTDVFKRVGTNNFLAKNYSYRDVASLSFEAFQSFGFPLELTLEVLRERGLDFTESEVRSEFSKILQRHQGISRAGAEKKFGGHGIVVKEGDLSAENNEEMVKKTRLHTATHVVVAALEKVLGQKLPQAGSDISADRLRFDFTFPRKVTAEELKQAEDIANKAIDEDLPVSWEEMDTDKAFESGASGAFRHKYGPRVKVYTIGDKDHWFSKELCGGPHVKHTGEIGHIHITKEESVSGGNRRIRATID